MSSHVDRHASAETPAAEDRHIIVSGDDALANAIIDEFKNAGVRLVRLTDEHISDTEIDLAEAGIDHASAIVCAGEDDAVNLELALLARRANPAVRVVARLANDVLHEALTADNTPDVILDVAALGVPSVVEACLAHTIHPFEIAGTHFLVWASQVPRNATLRELCGDLDTVAVLHGENSPTPGRLDVCPSRDQQVRAGDWTSAVGTVEELAARGIESTRATSRRTRRSRLRRVFDAVRALYDDLNPAFYPVMVGLFTLIVGSTVVLHYCYLPRFKLTWIDSLYFTVETITTTGYGDFSFVGQATWLRLYATALMLGGVFNTALLISFISDVLLSRRFIRFGGRPRVSHLRNHVIVIGLGEMGFRVVTELTTAGYDVAVIEIDEHNRFLPTISKLDVPVIHGDATLRQTLESAGADRARGVAVMTRDEVVNTETGIVLAQMLGRRLSPEVIRPDVPLVLRVYDPALGSALAQRFGFINVRSTVELAAPWFVSAAMGQKVLGTFSIGQTSFAIDAIHVEPDSELDGKRIADFSTRARVIAIAHPDDPIELHPHHDVQLGGGDTVYVIGPYRELLKAIHSMRSDS